MAVCARRAANKMVWHHTSVTPCSSEMACPWRTYLTLTFWLLYHLWGLLILISKSVWSPSRGSRVHRTALVSASCSPQPDTSRCCKTTNTRLVHRVVCPFTPQLSLVLRPRSNGTLSWFTVDLDEIWTGDLMITSPTLYRTTTSTPPRSLVHSRPVWDL